ncbi:MAG: hypothetical protein JO083_09765 [Candidatus Eremiobacteraeota bacterium]|nr:hypothetical protein [Candidatus Eremiobacteraeota bacterium]
MSRTAVAILLVVLTACVRMHPFLEGNDDGDVGAYVLGARALLHGALPYTTVWEYKPPGLFALYAVALAVAVDGSRAAALLGLLAACATSLLLWRLVARTIPDGERAGIVAAVLYACCSIENDGLLGDAELLIAPFAAGSLLALAGRPNASRAALAGLLAAAAVQMKLSAAPFAVVAVLVALRAGGWRALAPFAAAFAAPYALEALLYALAHRFGELWDANVGATLRRIASRGATSQAPRPFAVELRMLAPALELAPFAALRSAGWVGVFTLWLAADVLALVAVGEYDLRQFLPLVAPLAALGGIGADALARRVRFGAAVPVLACLLAFGLHGYFEVNSSLRIAWMRDVRGVHDWRISEVDRIIARLHGVPLARDGAWFMEVTPLAYDRLGVTPPTKYPLTSNLLNRALWPMLGLSGAGELARIVDCARPRWIVARNCGPWCDPQTRDATLARIRARYAPAEKLDARTTLYVRNDAVPARCPAGLAR